MISRNLKRKFRLVVHSSCSYVNLVAVTTGKWNSLWVKLLTLFRVSSSSFVKNRGEGQPWTLRRCLTNFWHRPFVFASVCPIFSFRRLFLSAFWCKNFWRESHDRNSGACNLYTIISSRRSDVTAVTGAFWDDGIPTAVRGKFDDTSLLQEVHVLRVALTLVRCVVKLTPNSCRYAVISKPCILVLSTTFSGHVSLSLSHS